VAESDENLVVTRTAEKEIIGIWKCIADDCVDAADKVCDELEAAMQMLCEMPGMGHPRSGVKNPAYRFWPVYSYLIVYRVSGEKLTVSRVIHGARNLRRIFRKWKPKR
jgi:plasmid stabilization system protein ParE